MGWGGGHHKVSWLHKGIQMKCYQINAKWKWWFKIFVVSVTSYTRPVHGGNVTPYSMLAYLLCLQSGKRWWDGAHRIVLHMTPLLLSQHQQIIMLISITTAL